MLSSRQLITFHWAAKLGSFTAAARRLQTTQSVVSMRIGELERQLGVELFDRRRRSATLTAKGQKLLGYAEELLRLTSEARESVTGDADAPETLRLGVAEVVSITWLPRLIRTIHARYPKIRLELDEALTGDLLARLREGSLDLVLAPGTQGTQRLASCSLGTVEFAWMASPQLQLPKRHLRPRDLQKWPVIALSRESYHHAAIERWFASENAQCRRIDTCKSTGVAASLAAAGLGLSFLPVRCYRREISDGQLRVVKTLPATPPVEFIAVSSTDNINRFPGSIAALAADISDFDKGATTPARRRAV
jgi:DNA-binding transcriptional LysR family regulator